MQHFSARWHILPTTDLACAVKKLTKGSKLKRNFKRPTPDLILANRLVSNSPLRKLYLLCQSLNKSEICRNLKSPSTHPVRFWKTSINLKKTSDKSMHENIDSSQWLSREIFANVIGISVDYWRVIGTVSTQVGRKYMCWKYGTLKHSTVVLMATEELC